jgi:acyl-CoA reductase-like NAD-dependent aldehyde dehydrogenase
MPEIRSPYDDSLIATVSTHSEQDVRTAIASAAATASQMAKMTAFRRGQILHQAAQLIEAQHKDLAELMTKESGKPIKYARGEVNRSIETFMFAADVARSLHGETIPLDAAKGGIGKIGYYLRVPVGVVAAITPFNFPLNLVAHKVAPAIAAGCPIVLKPAPATPLTALCLQEILLEAGLPEHAFSIVLGNGEVGHWLTTDPRVAMITFTGSPPVAHAISKVAGLRRTTFELGGNAATVIDEDADIDKAVERCVMGSFVYSGQVCISIQRLYVHQNRYAEFREKFIDKTNRLLLGDPLKDSTDIGPMINDVAVLRVDAWLQEAVAQGATVATGGTYNRRMFRPTVLENVKASLRIMRQEVFGPVVNLIPFTDFEAALDAVNDSEFGLQAGVYTHNLQKALLAVERLDVGGVIINDVPTFRVDHMPYGGNKNSGVGREGPRFAIEDMTTLKMVVIST